ncbi:hypothetical protein NX059_005455 [Plenodomus lindquistii]|nr:hypothetical protein NX059_005455 [Plenodomus lindquistii]
MADVKKETDGPAPDSSAGFDFTLLPDFDNDFIEEHHFVEFDKALSAPDLTSPSAEDLSAPPQPESRTYFTALSDWRPIHQRVRRKKNGKAAPRRGPDETREGFVYVLLKWPLLVVVLGWLLFLSIAYVLTRFYVFMYEHWVTWRGARQKLRTQLQKAKTYQDWVRAAKELDKHLKNDAWKQKPEYSYYDSKTIKKVYAQMASLRKQAEADEEKNRGNQGQSSESKAVDDLRAIVEACVKNNFVGFENPRLYSETYYGTKDLVQNYVDEAEASLSFLLRTSQLDAETKRAMFKHLGSNFGRTALCLSGGATFAYYHFGVAKALLDADLLPEVITGTSGGALVAALLCTRTDEELKKLLVPALAHRLTACHESTLEWVRRWFRTGARFDAVDWAQRLAYFTYGSLTFREAYERTGRILNVSCVPADPHSPTILANYITAPDCVIWSSVLASAAVPAILNPVVLMKKNKDGTLSPYSFGHKWKDGSLRTDIPLKALNLHFNVRFSIVSQVNPHINIFFFSSRGSVGRPVTHRRGRGWRGGFLGSALEQYIKLDLQKWLKVLRHLELLPRPLGQDWSELWLQRFSGTITIWPKSIPSDFLYILTDPTPQRLARMIHVGQQSAFPKLQFIANRAKLENIIHQGRRQYRPRGTRDGDITNVLSEDDLQNLLRRTKSGEGSAANHLSGSDSSSDGDFSHAGTPITMPLGFNFGQRQRSKKKRNGAAAHLETTLEDAEDAPDSPSLSKRLSGWWSQAISPQATAHNTALNSAVASPRERSRARGLASGFDRPNSMFELRPPRELSDLLPGGRRSSRVVVDDDDGESEDGDGDGDEEGKDASSSGRLTKRRFRQQRDGTLGDAEKRWEYGELEDFGDDEEEVQDVAAGLGIEGSKEGL